MENEDVWEVLKEWEQIPPIYSPSPNTAQWDDDGDTVVIRDTISHSSVFPPFNHEGLPVIPQEQPRLPSPSPPASGEGDGMGQWNVKGEVWRRLRAPLRVFNSGIVRLAHRIGNYTVCGVGCWSIATATGGAVAMAFAMASLFMRMKRWRRRRSLIQQENVDNLKLLIKEKDQRIKQLLLQIAQMNEILSGSKRVPVFRVG